MVVLLFIFGCTLANMATFDLRLVHRNGERQLAREAAEAGLSHVTAMICQDPTVGANDEVFQQTLPDGSSYRITFDPDDPDWSCNNLSSLGTGAGGRSRTVPPNHALIFAEGRSKGGEVALIESLIRLEALPYAIAATSRISTSALGGVTVNGAETRTGPKDLRGSTYSGSDANNSTVLGPTSQVSGDVHSVGGASVSPSQVDGDIETEHDIVALPNFNIEDFSTLDTPGRRSLSGGGLLGLGLVDTFNGPVYIDGDEKLLAVTMNNAVVYVDGDLDIAVLLGSGAIFVNGNTRFLAPITLNNPSDRITLFSKGDITVNLLGIFQGVLMTQGNFRSNGLLAVDGAVYANGSGSPTGGTGNVQINGLLGLNRVTHVSEFTAFASYWLAMGGEAEPVQVYWNQIR